MRSPRKWIQNQVSKAAVSALNKYIPYSTGANAVHADEPEPPYQRQFDPRWIYSIRRNHALINNAIEEKVSQTFRRGFDDWEKEYEAKCPKCNEEYGELTRFEEERPDSVSDDLEVDLDSSRKCPECGEIVDFLTPDPEVRDNAQEFFDMANGRNGSDEHLQPTPSAGIGQSFLEVCKEVAWDIQSFDDGWMLFEREYNLDDNGHILGYELSEVFRLPPDKMNYSFDEETGRFGNEYWICVECRETSSNYRPETQPQPCSECGSKTYEVYAYASEHPGGREPEQFYIRGEFAHGSEYEPSRFYGYSPVISLYDEARAIEKMDDWYREAYEQRRAPRGAMIIRSSNADATRKWNRGQMEKLNSDPNHIPTMMDDSEGGGGSDPLKFVNLLESPAEMQQMEMRDWIKNRISAKYGVTEIMMSGSPDNSGLSQSMEVQVSNRAADRLRRIFNGVFIPAFLGQIGTEGWEREVADVEEEDELAAVEKQQRELQVAQQAAQLGLEVEWTRDNTASVKAGEIEMEEDGGMGGLGEMLGGDAEEAESGGEPGPPESDGQPQLGQAEAQGGAPGQESRPQDDESAFGRMAKELREGKTVEVFNDDSAQWEEVEVMKEFDNGVIAQSESGKPMAVFDDGRVISA